MAVPPAYTYRCDFVRRCRTLYIARGASSPPSSGRRFGACSMATQLQSGLANTVGPRRRRRSASSDYRVSNAGLALGSRQLRPAREFAIHAHRYHADEQAPDEHERC